MSARVIGSYNDYFIVCPQCNSVICYNVKEVEHTTWTDSNKLYHVAMTALTCPQCGEKCDIRYSKPLFHNLLYYDANLEPGVKGL